MLRHRLATAVLVLIASAAVAAQATRPAAPDPGPVFKDAQGLAVRGYDVVAYHLEGKAVAGIPEHAFEHLGATWRFASAEHLTKFQAEPDKYLPQYGGYCAMGMAGGYKAPVDPTAFKLVGGKLYLNYSPKVAVMWAKDIPAHIAKADANWKKLEPKAAPR